ncbi:MAG TPA: DUF3373 family protein [Oligoflexus sp.]|uniref:DUF3373 family protein n=1 Tax=Oligoflexus sp. TaxID=1971216 RepID=UPI002D81160A|nr:DUF3373 family protein [Oligoflexus sp.]HET9239689.1 DUF3373 family protein [Oligoflexus sp.]
MKNILPLILLSAAGNVALAADDDLAKRVDALEMAGYSSTLKWSGFMENRYDQYTRKESGQKDVRLNISSNLVGIDFSSSPLPNVTIFGRLTYSNVYNNQGGTTVSNSEGRRYNSTLASFERLFLNYKVIEGLTLSAGRLPTLDGPPSHIYDGLPRQGSYPRQVYSTPLDGYAATYSYAFSQTQSLSARLVYTPLSQIDIANNASGEKTYNKNDVPGSTALQNSQVPLSSWMLDYNLTGSAIARDITAIYQGFQFKDYKASETWKFDYRVDAIYLEVQDIASIGLTAYASHIQTKFVNEGGLNIPIPGNPVIGGVGKAGELDATVKGKATIMGVHYQLPVEALKNPALGYETHSADKNSILFDFAARDPMAFYTQRGKGSHVYYSQPLNQAMKLRIGLMQTKPEYSRGYPVVINPATNTFQFEPTKVDFKETSVYASLRTDF